MAVIELALNICTLIGFAMIGLAVLAAAFITQDIIQIKRGQK